MSKDENQNIEFKKSWRDEYIKWVCGFANAQGGKIYIGINDRGDVVGVKEYKKLLKDIPNKILDILGIIVDVNLEIKDNKKYIIIAIEPYPYPISYKGRYHYRTGSTKKELKGASLDKFLLSKQGKRWDGVPIPYINIDELDTHVIEFFKEKATKKMRIEPELLDGDNDGLIEKLHLYEGEYLKRAAILLFYKEPEKFITGSYIKIGYFKTDSELIYQDTIRGNILQQVQKCEDLVFSKYLKAHISFDGMQRVESFPISQLAFREAIINAIVHKDYGDETPIQISVYDHKLLIYNSGELPQNWTIKTLLAKHSSKPYNPTIANVFFLTGYVESWGRGIDKITQESKKYNLLTPKFKIDNGLWVEFNFKASSKLGGKLGDRLGNKLGDKLSKNRKLILAQIRENPFITIPMLSDKIGISKTAIENNIKYLKNNHILKRIGDIKNGSWEIKGIDKTTQESKKHSLSTPKFKTENELWVNFNLKSNSKLGDKLGNRLGDKLGGKLGDRLGDKLSKNRKLILAQVRENPFITIPMLSDKIGISATAIENNIKYLKDNHILKRVGDTKNGSWEIIDEI